MGIIKNLIAGFVGSIALNVVHETLRRNHSNVLKINLLNEEALHKTLFWYGTPMMDEAQLYHTRLKADLVGNAIYYSLIGGKTALIWPKAIFFGLSAGLGAINLPKPMGLAVEPVAKTNQMKVLTVSYYLFGALVTGLILKTLSK